ncbi:hypothetical protein [Phnomibacter ginsenosidimutans]|jgi:hypothetical protein|uniref:Lipocalin-like domain-containing protein n=1 Tax=Phnomibacter ginsenosidimutans TaxID=2676868 RepID=A0A6I6G9V0_9BACT|nr:hypothetical protein [Phnomibacter ginsenosidimutans]QGW28343.1 hypothetical protein GLV81_09770 [Phnomibacter ginsenosidimutans]
MKLTVTLLAASLAVVTSGCIKEGYRTAERRILGEWRIDDVNPMGWGGNSARIPFNNGRFTFYDNGTLSYVNDNNQQFSGSWYINRRWQDDEQWLSMQITAVDFVNQQVLSQFYENLDFRGRNRLRAETQQSTRRYVTYFRR